MVNQFPQCSLLFSRHAAGLFLVALVKLLYQAVMQFVRNLLNAPVGHIKSRNKQPNLLLTCWFNHSDHRVFSFTAILWHQVSLKYK